MPPKLSEPHTAPTRLRVRLGQWLATLIVVAMLAVAVIACATARYMQNTFGTVDLDQLLLYPGLGYEGTNTTPIIDGVRQSLTFAVLALAGLYAPIAAPVRRVAIRGLGRILGPRRIPMLTNHRPRAAYKLVYATVVLVASLGYLLKSFGMLAYVEHNLGGNQVYDKHYVDPAKVDLQFPAKKRNLVYIFLESYENTVGSRQHGGASQISYMPELEEMALDPANVHFSNTDQLGGGRSLEFTHFTTGGLVAQSAGVQMRGRFRFDWWSQDDFRNMLPGAYTLGDVLHREGYNQTFMMGSDKKFGARGRLFSQHGAYRVFDVGTAKDEGKIPTNYQAAWGFEDSKLFSYAQEEITRLAAKPEPFNVQMLTINTHPPEGFLDPSCTTPPGPVYMKAYACSSAEVAQFVNWIRSQPFGPDTTIVLSGDHTGLWSREAVDDVIGKGVSYQRTVFNLILNPAISNVSPSVKHNRAFSTMDMYPTTLAALGVKIPGDRLALGTNLFSGAKTLSEIYGQDKLNEELSRRSTFYEQRLLLGKPAPQ